MYYSLFTLIVPNVNFTLPEKTIFLTLKAMIDVVLGLQRGDEGKGRIVDLLAEKYDIVARFNGGANAGHTIVPEGREPIALHQLPSGVAYPGKLNIIGNGVYLDPVRMVEEIKAIKNAGLAISPESLQISTAAHLVQPHHKELDAARESGEKSQGSTKAGIAFVAAEKYQRSGLRAENILLKDEQLYETALTNLSRFQRIYEDEPNSKAIVAQVEAWVEACRELKPYLHDTIQTMQDNLLVGKSVLAEGAQAFWLDIEHGMYPQVTSSHTTTGGVLNGLGVNHKHLGKVTGVAKVIKSHVGGGPFVTKITDEKLAAKIRGREGEVDAEFGATTKRPRQVGYFDLVELRSAIRVCGVDELVLTKMDLVERFGPAMNVATAYEFDGKSLAHAPSSAAQLERCTPIYKEFKTWHIDGSMKKFKDLPEEAQDFVAFVEKQLDVHVSMLGVGPKRHQVIFR
jgi:adenylosuccinate synthase